MKILVILLATLMVVGCANTGNKSVKNITTEEVDSKIKVGVTTQEEVRGMFGGALMTSFTDGGLAVWTYQYDDTSAFTKETVASAVLTFGLAGTKSKGTRTRLIILFDEKNIVKNYSISNSPIESGTGLF